MNEHVSSNAEEKIYVSGQEYHTHLQCPHATDRSRPVPCHLTPYHSISTCPIPPKTWDQARDRLELSRLPPHPPSTSLTNDPPLILTHPFSLARELGLLERQPVLTYPEPTRATQGRPGHRELPRRPRPLGELQPVVGLRALQRAQLERRAPQLLSVAVAATTTKSQLWCR